MFGLYADHKDEGLRAIGASPRYVIDILKKRRKKSIEYTLLDKLMVTDCKLPRQEVLTGKLLILLAYKSHHTLRQVRRDATLSYIMPSFRKAIKERFSGFQALSP